MNNKKLLFIFISIFTITLLFIFLKKNIFLDNGEKEFLQVQASNRRSHDLNIDGAKLGPVSNEEVMNGAREVIIGDDISIIHLEYVRETLRPTEYRLGRLNKEIPISNQKEALYILGDVIAAPMRIKLRHSYAEDSDYFFFWGSHSNEPNRGLAVRKSDGKLMGWSTSNDHTWRNDDEVDLTTDQTKLMRYFLTDHDWQNLQQELQDAAHAVAAREKDSFRQLKKYQEEIRLRAEARRKEREQSAPE